MRQNRMGRLSHRIERFLLGAVMVLLAHIVERRLLRAAGGRRG